MNCPFCTETLFHLSQIEDSPFFGKQKDDPKIHTDAMGLYCICHHCGERVALIGGAGEVRLAPNQKQH